MVDSIQRVPPGTGTVPRAKTAEAAAPKDIQIPKTHGALAPPEHFHEGAKRAVIDGKIYVSDTVILNADPQKVLEAVRAKDWSAYWSTGLFTAQVPKGVKLPPPVEGEVRFGMTPVHVGPVAPPPFAVQTFPPRAEALPDGGFKVIVPYKLTGGFSGDAQLEIVATSDGKTVLTSKWLGVSGPSGITPVPQILAAAHVWAEEKAFRNLGKLIGR